MLSIIGTIFGFISGPLSLITNKIIELKIKQHDATTEQEKIKASENIAVLERQRDVLVAEAQSGQRLTGWVRLFFVIPVAIYFWKLIVQDKIICPWWQRKPNLDPKDYKEIIDLVCSTDNLSDNLWWIVFSVIGFYFIQNIATIIKR